MKTRFRYLPISFVILLSVYLVINSIAQLIQWHTLLSQTRDGLHQTFIRGQINEHYMLLLIATLLCAVATWVLKRK